MPKRTRIEVPAAGRVTALYDKSGAARAGMQRPLLHVASLVLRENEGLEKLPASPLSPRQVLLTDAEDLDATESWSAARERRASRRERGLVALGHGPESRQRGHAASDVCVRAMRSHRG